MAKIFNPRMTTGLVPWSPDSHLGRPWSCPGSPPSSSGALGTMLHSNGFLDFPSVNTGPALG
jgi:hypothetical protein